MPKVQANTKNIGALFKNQYIKTKKSPILTGILELDSVLVAHLCRLLQAKKSAKLSLAGWKNISKEGDPYFTIKAQKEYRPPGSAEPDETQDEALDL